MPRPYLRAPVKILAFWAVFIPLHFAYRWLPVPLVAVFSGTNESFIAHAKIGFFAWSAVSLAEVALRRGAGLLTSRMLSAVILPWVMFLLWYVAPNLLGGPWPTTLGEILYANAILLVMAAALALLEGELERVSYSPAARGLVAALYALSILHLVAFTFREPWAGFFTE